MCRYIIYVYLCVESSATTLRGFIWPENIDLIIYIRHDPHTQFVSVRFVAKGTQTKNFQNGAMGFELATGRGVQTCKVAQWEPWRILFDFGFLSFYRLLKWDLVIADESGLQPLTWPSNDDDVQRAQFFKLHFGADGKDMVTTDSPSKLQQECWKPNIIFTIL